MRSSVIVAGTAITVVVAGCGAPPRQAPPPAEVSVITVAPRSVDQVFEFVGNVEASKSVPVRAQVAGIITERPFTEGAPVQAGQVLYRIDSTTYYADWQRAEAQLQDAEARYANAEQNRARLVDLLRDHAIAQQEYDNAEAEAKRANAAVADARAAAAAARKHLNDTVVRAELAGRVGRTLLDLGARVRGTDDILTNIDVLNPIYVTFRPSAQQLLAWKRDLKASRLMVPGGGITVHAVLSDGGLAPAPGRLTFIDPVVDPATGTQQFRAEFPNADRFLVPGAFVRVRLSGLTLDSALVVPQRAVLQQLGHQAVYVVAAGDTVRVRDVIAAVWTEDDWLIQSGLAAGDRVIVDGVQKVGPGTVVRPVPLAAK
jgi:membrane fusion protein (multidrug efflux system)